MTRRKRNIVVVVLALLLAGIGVLAWRSYQVLHSSTRDAHALWATAGLVIEHMESRGGAWPRNWDELRSTANQAYNGTISTNRDGTVTAKFGPSPSIDELQRRVDIDWKADPKELAKAEHKEKGPPFRVIWLRSGKSTYYPGKEPNEMVLEHLRWREERLAEPDSGGNR